MDSSPLPQEASPTPVPHEPASESQTVPPAKAGRRSNRLHWRPAIGWFYSANPFYVLGTLLVFTGLRISFNTDASQFPTELLLVFLLGFNGILATFAFVLIRWGQVWDDVRSLLLLIMLLLVGVSVTLDELLAENLLRGGILAGLTYVYALAIVSWLLVGLRIRIARQFVVPLVLILATILLYPATVKTVLDAGFPTLGNLLLAGYPAVGGLVALTLLPAVRRGPAITIGNGTPWTWPLFPWSLFVVMGVGFVGRAYYLCQSFGIRGGDDHFFGPYLLAPFLLAMCVLLLEEGLRRGSETWQHAVQLISFAVLLVATEYRDTPYGRSFLTELHDTLVVSWSHLVAILLVLFHAWSLLRRARGATSSLSCSLLALNWFGPDHQYLLLADWCGIPLVLLAGLQITVAIRRHEGLRAWLAVGLAIVGCQLQWPGMEIMRHQGVFVTHTMLVAALLIGVWFRDESTRLVHAAALGLLPLTTLQVLNVHREFGEPWSTLTWYGHANLLTAIAGGYSYWRPYWEYRPIAASTWILWATIVGGDDLIRLRQQFPGFDLIVAGVAALVVAVAISIVKGRQYRRQMAMLRVETRSSA